MNAAVRGRYAVLVEVLMADGIGALRSGRRSLGRARALRTNPSIFRLNNRSDSNLGNIMMAKSNFCGLSISAMQPYQNINFCT